MEPIKTEKEYHEKVSRRRELHDKERWTTPEREEHEQLELMLAQFEKRHWPTGVKVKTDPCPFCASLELGIDLLTVNNPHVLKATDTGFRVKCKVCGALGARAVNEEEAIDRWNMRTW